uniref:Uncharacterized protein n=1 Tax=viral metagenome TaxID=1070528 RepID=A0A6C0KI05_9ZZZZ
MEKRINKKIETYVTSFKDQIRNKINELEISDKNKMNELMEYVYEYPRFTLCKEDLSKRKRIKNSIPSLNRCSAKRANGEQCTRRRKEGCEFCGTHSKGTPNGLIQGENVDDNGVPYGNFHKLEVFAEEVKGIVYYLDKYNNVYNTEDILSEKQNPRIIAKYVKDDNKYTIPELGLV